MKKPFRQVIFLAGALALLAPMLMGQGVVQIDQTKEPPNVHIRPSSLLYNEIFVCRAESPEQWIGVSNYFTRYDPWIVAVARVQTKIESLPEFFSVDLAAPNNRIIASDRGKTERGEDHGIFYRTDRLLHLGGYGEWQAVLSVEGVPREAFKFTLAPEPWRPPVEVDPESQQDTTPPFTTNLPIHKKTTVVDDKISDLLKSFKRYW